MTPKTVSSKPPPPCAPASEETQASSSARTVPTPTSTAPTVPQDEPPAYTAGPSMTTQLPPQSSLPSFPNLDYSQYLPTGATLSDDRSTVAISHSILSSKPETLTAFIRKQAALPPKPLLYIKGTLPDLSNFHLKLNLLPLVYRSPPKNPWNYVKIINDGELGFRGGSSESTKPNVKGDDELLAWAKKYCHDPSSLKSFTLLRRAPHLSKSTLEGLIRNLLAPLNCSDVQVTFGAQYHRVVVQPPSNPLQSMFSLVMKTKRYQVVEAVWPFAKTSGEEGEVREVAVQSEAQWWSDWKEAIRRAVLERRKGWVSIEDRLEVAMRPE